MIRLLVSKIRNFATTMLLLTSPMLAIGQNQSDTVVFIDQGSPGIPMITYYHAIPGRFFIQKSDDVSQEYIISLLDKLTDATFEYSWCSTSHALMIAQDSICRVIMDDALIDKIIDELLKDDGILAARRIYMQSDFFNKYVAFLQKTDIDYTDYFKEPNLKKQECYFFNSIFCYPDNPHDLSIIPMDSICNDIGIYFTQYGYGTLIAHAPKDANIFEIADKLNKTGYFIRVDIVYHVPTGKFSDDVYGAKINRSDHFFYYDNSIVYFHEIQGRFFVEKADSVTQDYINELLDNAINGDFETEWLYDNLCRVIVDEELIDNIIDQILKDGGITTARRIYVKKSDYNSYLFYPDLEQGERYILNDLIGYCKGEYNQVKMDSISNSLGLTYRKGDYNSILFLVPKHADIFEVAQKIFEAGGFSQVCPRVEIPPIINHWGETYISQPKEEVTVKEELYYNLAGQRTDTPSGLTIVVTRYSDGSVRREKKLFR